MFLIPLLFIILVVWLLVYLFRAAPSRTAANAVHNTVPSSSSTKPIEILKERYAKGEISEEEYLRIKRNLE